jgi:hypothetical protein
LLDRALGQMPGFLSAGEVRYLWDRGLRDDQRCGCGEPFSGCPFWTEVGVRAFGGWDRLDLDEVLGLQRDVGGVRAMPALMSPIAPGRFRRKLERFGAYLDRVYEGITHAADVPVVIDSSMSPPYALVLRRVKGIDLRLVHLVRDPRGVAYSSAKTVVRPELRQGTGFMPTYRAGEAALRWTAANFTLETLGRRVPYIRVRYESFVRDPGATLRGIAGTVRSVGDEGPMAFLRDGAIVLGENHMVAGNPMRFRTGELEMRLDEAWRTQLAANDRRKVTAIAYPMLRRYGYLAEGSA